MDGLDLVAKERYKQKLESVGLQVSDDPYLEANSHRFRDDMSCGRGSSTVIFLGTSLNDQAHTPRSSCFRGSN